MPAVPTVTTPTVAPTGSTGLPYQTAAGATPAAFGGDIAQAEIGLGRQVEQTSDVLAKHALKMQEDLNTSVAKDSFLAADIEVGQLTTDYNSKEGLNRAAAYPKFIEDVNAVRAKYKSAAPNDDVAKKFDQDFARRVGYTIVDGARSAATATKQVQRETNNAVRANTLDHIAQNAQDDQRFETELQIGRDTFKSSDEYKGSSPEVQAQHDKAYTTAAWATRLQSMSKADPLRARELLNKNKEALDGGKYLQLQDSINQSIINVQSRVESDKIVQSGALVPPELRDRVKKFEGYRETPYSDYKQTSSGFGTKAQPGDENIPAGERRAVFEQRLDNELARAANIVDQFAPGLPSGTRQALISLTYNAGGGWTSAGLGQQVRAGDLEGARQTFLQYNKAGGETNPALVERRATEASWWGGERQPDRADQLTESMNKAKEVAARTFPDDPGNQARYLDTLQSRIRADHSVLETSARTMQLDNRNKVMRELVDENSAITSYDRLSPDAKQAYDISPPSQQAVFNRQMRSNATRDVPLTSERQSLFDTVRGEIMLEPDKGLGRNVSELDLTRNQKSQLQNMIDKQKQTLAKGSALNANMSAVQGLLNDAGIGKSATDTSKNEQWLKFGGVFQTQVDGLESEKKRKATDAEKQDIAKGLLKEIVTSPGYIWDSKARTYEVLADRTPVTLKSDDPATHYASLPRGTTFVGPDGQKRTKP